MPLPQDFALHRIDPARPPVVLLGGVNLVRTLGLAGITAIVASPNPDEPAFASRYCAARVDLPRYEDAESVVDVLMSLGDRLAALCGRRVPLMYGGDDALGLIYAHRERLQRYFLFLINDPDVAEALVAKDRFHAFALRRGLPVPRTLQWEGAGPGSVAGTPGPVVVKPKRKADWHNSLLCHRLFDNGDGKARVFASGAGAAADPVVASFRDQLTVQEYIAGGDRDLWSFHGFADEQGRVLASFVGRKLRTFPVEMGESAFIEMARDPSLDALGRDVVRRCPLKGVFKMDFKRDPATGRWYLLEINARYTLWNYLGACNGLNLAAIAYDYLVSGARPLEVAYGTSRRWLAVDLDFKAYRQLAARDELSFARWLASIAFTRKVHNVLAWTDPWPFVRLWSARVARKAGRSSTRFLTAMRQWRSTAS